MILPIILKLTPNSLQDLIEYEKDLTSGVSTLPANELIRAQLGGSEYGEDLLLDTCMSYFLETDTARVLGLARLMTHYYDSVFLYDFMVGKFSNDLDYYRLMLACSIKLMLIKSQDFVQTLLELRSIAGITSKLRVELSKEDIQDLKTSTPIDQLKLDPDKCTVGFDELISIIGFKFYNHNYDRDSLNHLQGETTLISNSVPMKYVEDLALEYYNSIDYRSSDNWLYRYSIGRAMGFDDDTLDGGYDFNPIVVSISCMRLIRKIAVPRTKYDLDRIINSVDKLIQVINEGNLIVESINDYDPYQ